MKRQEKQYLEENRAISLVDLVQSENSQMAILLLCENFRDFIAQVVNATIRPGIEEDDLLQIGKMGIIHAAQTFDKNRGVKFADYAMSQARSKIISAVRDINIVHLPRKDAYTSSKFAEATENLLSPEEDEEVEKVEPDDVESFLYVLTTDEKTVINLTYYEDMPIKDISEQMGLHWRKVHKLKISAVLKLKKRMQGIVAEPKVRFQVNNERWGEMLQDIFNHKFKRSEVLQIKYSIGLKERELIEEFHVHGNIKEFAENADLSIEELRARQRLIEKKMAHAVNQIISGGKTKVPVLNSAPTLNLADLWRNV